MSSAHGSPEMGETGECPAGTPADAGGKALKLID